MFWCWLIQEKLVALSAEQCCLVAACYGPQFRALAGPLASAVHVRRRHLVGHAAQQRQQPARRQRRRPRQRAMLPTALTVVVL